MLLILLEFILKKKYHYLFFNLYFINYLKIDGDRNNTRKIAINKQHRILLKKNHYIKILIRNFFIEYFIFKYFFSLKNL
jgi:hypothetical protein